MKSLQGASTSPPTSSHLATGDWSDPGSPSTAAQLQSLSTSTLTAAEEHSSSSLASTELLTAAEKSPSSASSPCESLSVAGESVSHHCLWILQTDWPALSDKVRGELVTRGPYQTERDLIFSKREDGCSCRHRYFLFFFNQWWEDKKELACVFQEKKKSLFCFCCKLFSQMDFQLIYEGLKDWKNASQVLNFMKIAPNISIIWRHGKN